MEKDPARTGKGLLREHHGASSGYQGDPGTQEIKSIIVYPLNVGDRFFGFIGFDECSRIKQWERSELELLRTITGMIVNACERRISETPSP